MLYSLGLNIINNNEGILNAVRNILPLKNDSKIWPDEYLVGYSLDENSNRLLYARIDFCAVSDRDALHGSIKGLQGILQQCLPGSFIQVYKNSHKWNIENPNNIKQCEIEIFEVIE